MQIANSKIEFSHEFLTEVLQSKYYSSLKAEVKNLHAWPLRNRYLKCGRLKIDISE